MAFEYAKDAQNLVTLTMNLPGRPVNVINDEMAQGLAQALDRLEAEKDLAGVILTSAKKVFMAGGDIDGLYKLEDPEEAFRQCEDIKALFRRLETLGKPVVAAIAGHALGGGLELALACHYRIALDHPGIQIGFPEVTLGLLPGAGGVTRLPRLIGLQEAFGYLTEGKRVNPGAALESGIVHDLASDGEALLKKARAWALANPDSAQPWDQKGYRMRGGDPRSPKVAQMVAIAPAMLRKKTHGNYPAPQAILNAAVEGALVDFDTASRIESRYFAQLATGPVAKNMITAFWYQLNGINSGSSRPADVPPQKTGKVGVLGAGLMGHGIAYVSAVAGIEVVLKDVDTEKAEAGKARIAAILDGRVARGRMTPEKRDEVLGRVHATGEAADLDGCDLIIEAVFEDRALKARVTEEAEVYLDAGGVFASNTSTLPITGLAQASKRPEHFIGIHFFSPVHKMKLVEIIVGEATTDETLARAFDYVIQIKKIPIVVNDRRGFYTSRVFGTYVSEGLALLEEGQHPRAIESAGLAAGMPVGPLAVADEVGLSLAMHIRKQTEKDLAAEGKEAPVRPGDAVLDVLVDQEGRTGKAGGGGFYEYPQGGKKFLWKKLQELFPLEDRDALTQREMIDRMLFVQCLDTVRCLEEGVLRSVADANIGSIFGWGFAPFQGGTLQAINAYGLPAFVERSRELATRYGDRFAPPARLLEMAEKGERF
jgi:3-hydroxyacyl-CoA dehydrogenase/enoyl-CoA hydratase/3-hydroxybutyryl-CoA epimerase